MEIMGRAFLAVGIFFVLTLGAGFAGRWFDLQEQQIQADMSSVDSVVSVNVDTLYIERPADIVKITIKEIGELTEADLVNILCPPKFRETKEFWHNALGMVACYNPEREYE